MLEEIQQFDNFWERLVYHLFVSFVINTYTRKREAKKKWRDRRDDIEWKNEGL